MMHLAIANCRPCVCVNHFVRW